MDELLYEYTRSIFNHLTRRLKGKLYFHIEQNEITFEILNNFDFRFDWTFSVNEIYKAILHGVPSYHLANEIIEHYKKVFDRFIKSKLFHC